MKKSYMVAGVFLAIVLVAASTFTLWAKKPVEALVNRALRDAEKRIGRQITVGKFGGNPFVGFSVRDIAIKAKVEGETDTLRIDSLKLRVSLPMLLRRKVVFKEIQLLNPTVYMERFPDGANDFNDIIEALAPKDEKEKKPPTVFFQKIRIRDMALKLKLLKEEGDPVEIVVEPVNLSMEPTVKDSYGDFKIKVDGKMNGLYLSGNGALRMEPELDVTLDWKTNQFEIDTLPDFLSAYFKKMDVVRLTASVEASGNVRAGKEKLSSESRIEMKNTEALSQKFGDGFLNLSYGEDLLKFDGELGKRAPLATLEGQSRSGDEPVFSSLMKLVGIDVTPAVQTLLRGAAPDIISGTLSGDVKSKGPGFNMKTLSTDAALVVKNGILNYPTPALKGEGSGRAPMKFERIDIKVNHKQPRVTVREARIVATGVSASATGVITYLLDKKTGAPTAPASFDIYFKTESKNIEELLKLNKYTGPAISGSLSTKGNIKGDSSDMNSLAGDVTFAMLNGIIVNPYMDSASNLPMNANLSHFAYDSIRGRIGVADGVASSKSIKLLSSLIDADARGSINFDGGLNAHVEASMSPSVLNNIADFQSVLPKITGVLNRLDRVDASFELSGTVQNPLIHWNADDFAKEIGKQMLSDKADDVMNDFLDNLGKDSGGGSSGGKKESLKDKIKDKLKGLF